MIPEPLKSHRAVAALEPSYAGAIVNGKFDLGELTLEIASESIVEVCAFLKKEAGFIRISSVTAVDRYPSEPRFEVIYHLHSIEHNERLRLKSRVGGQAPAIASVTSVWRGADWYEREVFDLFGVHFTGHPDLRRIMMPDDWAGYPLRKDYAVEGYK